MSFRIRLFFILDTVLRFIFDSTKKIIQAVGLKNLQLLLFLLYFFFIGNIAVCETKSDASDFSELNQQVDSLVAGQNPDSEKIAVLLKKISRISWSQYYQQYKDQGPVRRLMNYCRQQKFFSEEIACVNGFGVMYRQMGKPVEAEHTHLRALELSTEYRDTINMMMSLNNLGVNARRIDDLKKASDFHMEVLKLAEKYTNQSNIVKKSTCIALNSLGNINISLKQYDKAIEILKQSNAIERSMNSEIGQAINHANIGEAFELSGQLDSARTHYNQSLQLNEKAGSKLGIALCYNNLGAILQKEKQYDQALPYYEKAIGLIRTTGDKYHLIISLQGAARIWIEKKQYVQAAIFLDEAIQLARDIDARFFMKEGFLMLATIREATGNFREALAFTKLSHQYSDSIFNEENQRHLIDIQTRYETKQKEQQIALLNRANELKNVRLKYQKLVIWSGSFLIVGSVLFLWFFLRQRRKRQQTRQAELEQKLLRSQMNPHFIFNSLGAIQNFMLKNDGRKAAFYLSSFSALMRSILKNSREELISVHEEMQTLENYLQLHQLRLGDKLSFSVDSSDELEVDEITIPPMLVQPFVENAIIHGIEKKDSPGNIDVYFQEEDNHLVITVEDNGPGISDKSQQPEGHISYALQIFRERVENLKRMSGTEVFYSIESKNSENVGTFGTRVTVRLPLK